ncbi:MAG: PEP-CTERM sorting domain-containing protein [Bythopirellula sp.]
MKRLVVDLQLGFCVAIFSSLLVASLAHGQATFVSSDITLQVSAEASDIDGSDFDTDMAGAINVEAFMDHISATANRPVGSGSFADATSELSFMSDLIEASGRTSADAIGSEFDPANSFGDVGFELSFSLATATSYKADVFLTNDISSGSANSAAEVRLFDSSGTNIFSHIAAPGGPVIEPMMGTLAPETYTLQAFANSNALAGEIDSGGNTFAEFDVTLDFRPPSMGPMFMFDCEDFGFCVEEFVPIPRSIHGIMPGLADEPIPFWTDGFGLTILLNQQFDFGDGPMVGDLAILEAPLDQFVPETDVQVLLAFESGSLDGIKEPEKLPPATLIAAQAKLIGPNGIVLNSTRLQLVPEPSSVVLLLGLLGVAGCNRATWRRGF